MFTRLVVSCNSNNFFQFYRFLSPFYLSRRSMIAKSNVYNDTKINETISKLSVEVHILSTSLSLGEDSDVIILDCLERVLSLIMMIKEPYEMIYHHANRFNCCSQIQHNGFHSLCYLAEKSIELTLTTVDKFKIRKKSFFYNHLIYEQKFQNVRDLLCNVYFMLKLGEKMLLNKTNYDVSLNKNVKKSLIKYGEQSNSLFLNIDNPINNIMYETELFIDKVFFGSLLGYYYTNSIKSYIRNVGNAMAAFADALDKTSNKFGRAVTALAFSSMYSNNCEKRAQRLKILLSNPSVEFIKSFWALSEDYHLTFFTNMIGPSLSVDKSFKIPSTKQLIIHKQLKHSCDNNRNNESTLFILEPPVNKPFICVRLYSNEFRHGQKTLNDNLKKTDNYFPQESLPNSDGILLHCPGGGFLSQSPKSHSVYLKSWAKKLNLPIVSIDYSKAPESPFPSAVDECFYVYCWLLQNHNMMGSSAKKIGIVGDSAGGNLIYGVVNKAIENGIRVPDFIVAVYPVLCLEPTLTPSRILSTCDLLLSSEVLKLCLASYISDNACNLINNTRQSVSLIDDTKHVEKPPDTSTFTPNNASNFTYSNVVDSGNSDTTSSTKNQHEIFVEHVLKLNHINKDKLASERLKKYQKGMNEIMLKSEALVNSISKMNSTSFNTMNTEDEKQKTFLNEPSKYEQLNKVLQFFPSMCGWTPDKLKACSHHHISPLFTPKNLIKNFPKSYIIVSNVDPLLDDSVEFCKRLKKHGAPFELKVVEGLPHGFLQFSFVSSDASNATDIILQWIAFEMKGLSST